MAKARHVAGILEDTADDTDRESRDHYQDTMSPTVNMVQVRQSPYIGAFYSHHPVHLTIDSGATGNMILDSLVISMKFSISSPGWWIISIDSYW